MEKEMRLFWKYYLLLLLIKFPQGPSWCFDNSNTLVQSFFCQGRIACANVLSDLYAMGVVDCHNMLMLLGGELRLSNHNLQDEYNGNGAKTIMKGDNTLMILWCYQFNYLWYSNHMFLGSVSKEMTVAERDVVIPLMMQVHKDANASCLKEANLRESFLWLFPSWIIKCTEERLRWVKT